MNRHRFGEGYALYSPDNGMRIWTNHPMTVLKNADYLQIIEITIYNKKVFIINLHLNCKRSNRKFEITELFADIDHMELSH